MESNFYKSNTLKIFGKRNTIAMISGEAMKRFYRIKLNMKNKIKLIKWYNKKNIIYSNYNKANKVLIVWEILFK